MSDAGQLILGEFRRTLDERYRISIPSELVALVDGAERECLLAKEQPGALSLWSGERWSAQLQQRTELIRAKIAAGRLAGRTLEVQRLGRLLSTRHRAVRLAGRGRLIIPEGFREFLGVEPGGEVSVIGAALCIELWKPAAWLAYLNEQIPEFQQLYDDLSA